MKNRLSIIVLASLLLSATVAFGGVKAGEFSLSPIIGGYTFDGKQHLKTNLVYGARVGYTFTKQLGVEGLFDYVNTDSSQGGGSFKAYRSGAELIYNFIPDNVLVPFIAAGGGMETIKGDAFRRTRAMYDYGAGLKYFINNNFALRGDVRHILYSYGGSTFSNVEYTLGAYIPFGGVKPATKRFTEPALESSQPKAAPATVRMVAEPLQPSSSLSAMPATITSGQSGNLNWTSQNASDCAIQPAIGTVPLQGSKEITPTADTSYTLTCTGPGGNTTSRANVAVIAPPAPKPAPVAMSAQKAAAAERFCDKPAILAVQFDTNKADIKPKYKPDLDKLAEFLNEFPKATGEISGHTDNVGGKAFNMKLSQRRADSIKQYMHKNFGITPERITAKGFGFSKPVASNKTKQGKAKNRRIEANFSCK
ncbi:MAG: OmpA family protein [Desulfuromonadaceae bacterium]|nr:OmpA family protein [Desulfuromonadaceae bacterium]